ncbi:MAG TPA: hypothetical protein VIY09_00650 [Rhizomicrobium sp.]
MTKTITRVYDDYGAAKSVVRELEAAGLSDSSIGIVASNAEGWHKPGADTVDPKHDKARHGNDDRATGAEAGGGIGVVAGGTVGVLTGLGLLAIPGVGPVVAAGWLAATAAGAVAGGAAGGIIGALAGSGTSEENAELYAEAVRRGGAIVTARVPDDEEPRYAAIMGRSAIDVTQRAAIYRRTGWKGYDPAAPAYTAEQVRQERQTYL